MVQSVAYEKFYKEFSAQLRMLLITSAATNLLFLAPALYMIQIYDRVLASGSVTTLIWLSLILATALCVLFSLSTLRSRLLGRIAFRIEKLVSPIVVSKLLQKQSHDLDDRKAMRDLDTIKQCLMSPAATAVLDLPWVPIYILALFLIHPYLAAFVVVCGAAILAVNILAERQSHEGIQSAQMQSQANHTELDNILLRGGDIVALGLQRRLTERHSNVRQNTSAQLYSSQFSHDRCTAVARFLRQMTQSFILAIGALLAIDGQISAGVVIGASIIAARALQPFDQLMASATLITQTKSAFQNIVSFLPAKEAVSTTRISLPQPTGRISLEQLFYRYPGSDTPTLSNIAADIKDGEVVGLIGSSGTGKSTLAKLLANVIAPDYGNIRIDGAQYADWSPGSLADHIGYLPQDFHLFDGTIAENISRFSSNSKETDKKTVRAAIQSGAHNMILKLPDGYQTKIGTNGRGLSAGQRQRLALARALFSDPCVLILDEPDSALDAEGTMALLKTLTALNAHGKTIIVVSHRMATMKFLDRLILLSAGTIAMDGKAADVIAQIANPVKSAELRAV